MKKITIFAMLLFLIINLSIIVSAADTISEGFVKEKDGRIKGKFVHYLDNNNFLIKQKTPSQIQDNCYSPLAAHWLETPIEYVINPSNPQNLSERFITKSISKSAESWDKKTGIDLFSNSYLINYTLIPGSPDYINTIGFLNYSNPSIIAVTYMWFDSNLTQMIEFDQIYNTLSNWGDATKNDSVMDLQNVATHEFGHAIGLDHISTPECISSTMYPYTFVGETSKRTLEDGDIQGLRYLYNWTQKI